MYQCFREQPNKEPDFPLLSQRELDVLRLIAKGFSNAMVGVELEITDQTVKNHVSSILEKFDVFDWTSAVVKALLCKLISLNEFDLNDIVTKRRRTMPNFVTSFRSRSHRSLAFHLGGLRMNRLFPAKPWAPLARSLWCRGRQFFLTYVLFLGVLFMLYLVLHTH